jgi:hypothetical protein
VLRRGCVLWPVTIAIAVAPLYGCAGGGSAAPKQNVAAERKAYAEGVAAQAKRDWETAMDAFRDAGNYSDAPRRLTLVLRAGAANVLADARRKLRDGHPRAAVVLVQVAMRDYEDKSLEAQELLRRAQAAQIAHHRQQVAQQSQAAARQGSSKRP